MDVHLFEVHELQREGTTGCWTAVYFQKAFDAVSHPIVEAFLLHARRATEAVGISAHDLPKRALPTAVGG